MEAAVEVFYKKLLGDVRVARFFSGIPLSGSKSCRHALSLLASSDIALMSSHCSPEGTNKCPSQGKVGYMLQNMHLNMLPPSATA